MSMTLSSLRSAVTDTAENVRLNFNDFLGSGGKTSNPPIVLLLAAIFCAFAPLEISQLIFMLLGAAAYSLLQGMQPPVKRSKGKPASPSWEGRSKAPSPPARSRGGAGPGRKAESGQARLPAGPALLGKPDVRKPSSAPVTAPTFQAAGWEAEVEELLSQITPTPESDVIVQKLARITEQTVKSTIPEAEVVGFASGDLTRGKAFGVAVPDVDIVVNVSPHALANRLQGKLQSQGRCNAHKIDERKLQKSAIRACTDRLVSQGGFKFRRSAFRGLEPKVTLLAPASLGIFQEAVPVDFSVNAVTPLYNAALLTECGQIDARAKALILMVKRWAKDRGVCHAAKGHLSPYGWSLLTIYFLQVGVAEEGSLLPPLEAFARSSGLMQSQQPGKEGAPGAATGPAAEAAPAPVQAPVAEASKKSVGTLFNEFMAFYNRHFDWRKEAVCVRLGSRGPPGLKLPIHIVFKEDGRSTEVGPSIEDPFCPTTNLSSCMTVFSLQRLSYEFKRADELCSRGVSLTELLEPWVPPEEESLERSGDNSEDEAAAKLPRSPAASPSK